MQSYYKIKDCIERKNCAKDVYGSLYYSPMQRKKGDCCRLGPIKSAINV